MITNRIHYFEEIYKVSLNRDTFKEFPLVAQCVKDLVLSLQWLESPQWCRFISWSKNLARMTKKKKKGNLEFIKLKKARTFKAKYQRVECYKKRSLERFRKFLSNVKLGIHQHMQVRKLPKSWEGTIENK